MFWFFFVAYLILGLSVSKSIDNLIVLIILLALLTFAFHSVAIMSSLVTSLGLGFNIFNEFDMGTAMNVVGAGILSIGGFVALKKYVVPHLSRTTVEIACATGGVCLSSADVWLRAEPETAYASSILGNIVLPWAVNSFIDNNQIQLLPYDTTQLKISGMCLLWGWQAIHHQSTLFGVGSLIMGAIRFLPIYTELYKSFDIKINESYVSLHLSHISLGLIGSYYLLNCWGAPSHYFAPFNFGVNKIGVLLHCFFLLGASKSSNFSKETVRDYWIHNLYVLLNFVCGYSVAYQNGAVDMQFLGQIMMCLFALQKLSEMYEIEHWELLFIGVGCTLMGIPIALRNYPELHTAMLKHYVYPNEAWNAFTKF